MSASGAAVSAAIFELTAGNFTTSFVVANAAGQIIRQGMCLGGYVANQEINAGETALVMIGSVDSTQNYVSGGVITPRAACPVSGSASGRVVTLTGVPIGATVTVTGAASLTETSTDTTVALTFGAAGTYLIAVGCFPAIDYSGSFTLT